MKNKLRGTYTVIVTPFTEDGGAVDERMLRWLVDYQIGEGIHGLIPLASNGELLSLTDEERHEVARITVEQAAGRVPVVVSTTHESTDFAIRYTRDAEALGADAAMVMTPYYAWIDEEEIFTHFRRIAEAVSIPIMLYTTRPRRFSTCSPRSSRASRRSTTSRISRNPPPIRAACTRSTSSAATG